MSTLRWIGAAALGAYLFATPFLRYLDAGHGGEAHRNHDARHGGQLAMVGDHHVELRFANGRAEVFVSDALRVPVRPKHGHVVADDAQPVALRWQRYRLFADDVASASMLEVVVVLADGTRLQTTFAL